MKTYQEIKKESQDKLTELFEECGVFFAFSAQQFEENKTPLRDGEKYVSMGAGGYLPKGNVQKYLDGSKAISKWEKAEIKAAREGKEQHILYELNNHECFYTGDIEEAVAVLPYPRKEVLKVYHAKLAECENNYGTRD